jgi:hypothetical protein
MKKYLLIPALLLATGLFGFRAPGNWIKYSSADGHFSMEFPGKPEESSQDDKTEEGTPFKIHFATFSPSDEEVYMAGWIDMTTFFPQDKSLKEMLENSRDGASGSMNAKDVKTIETNLGANPYIEFTFTSDQFTGKDRIYIINKFQYSIITIFSLKKGLPVDADKFIRTFKFTGSK